MPTLSLNAQPNGMMTYYINTFGSVLKFRYWDSSKYDAELHIDWDATAGGLQPQDEDAYAVLQVDQTNCGQQRTDVSMNNAVCTAHNTGGDDTACYCNPVPCVLKSVTPWHNTTYLGRPFNGTADTTPILLDPEIAPYVIRLTARTSVNFMSYSYFALDVVIKNATIVLTPKGSQVRKTPLPTPHGADYFCNNKDLL